MSKSKNFSPSARQGLLKAATPEERQARAAAMFVLSVQHYLESANPDQIQNLQIMLNEARAKMNQRW
jgi:hypothetical protein